MAEAYFTSYKMLKFMVKHWCKYLVIILTSLQLSAVAQSGTAKLVTWEDLSKVDFEDKYYPDYEGWFLFPNFSESVKALNNQPIIIKGYIIPIDVEDNLYALSAYPFSSCFFCGNAGPESVMTLEFKNPPKKWKTDDLVNFTGILKLNDSDLENFNYILQEAIPLKK